MSRMLIQYGANGTFTDVTHTFTGMTTIVIPPTDMERATLFGLDPLPGILKEVRVTDDYGIVKTFAHGITVTVSQDETGKMKIVNVTNGPEQRLAEIHASLTLSYGSLRDEYPEQIMAVTFIRPDSRVLEIGGNIGRNSCVIGRILSDSRNLTVLESSPVHARELQHNRDQNGLNFAIVASALSKRRLIQKGWDTAPLTTDTLPPGWKEISTITWSELTGPFDTLVADCEGALFYILQDEPTMLEGFSTIIVENDYHVLDHKKYVDSEFQRMGFRSVYRKAGGWGPCYDRFFEVWQR